MNHERDQQALSLLHLRRDNEKAIAEARIEQQRWVMELAFHGCQHCLCCCLLCHTAALHGFGYEITEACAACSAAYCCLATLCLMSTVVLSPLMPTVLLLLQTAPTQPTKPFSN